MKPVTPRAFRSLLGLLALGLIAGGVTLRWGGAIACIVTGSLLLLALIADDLVTVVLIRSPESKR